MTQDYVLSLAREALTLALLLSAPTLGFGLAIGLGISILQATTQIQEQTLTFVPKIVAVLFALLLFGSWMLGLLTDFTQYIFTNLSTAVR